MGITRCLREHFRLNKAAFYEDRKERKLNILQQSRNPPL